MITNTAPQEAAAALALTNANSIALQLTSVRVTTSAQAQWAADVARQIRDQRKVVETERDSAVKPLRGIASKITKWFKGSIDVYEECERHLKNEISNFQALEATRQAEALREATTQAEVTEAVAVMAPPPTGTHQREQWTWAPTGAPIDPSYYILDTKRLDREATALKGGLQVAGIRPVRGSITVLNG